MIFYQFVQVDQLQYDSCDGTIGSDTPELVGSCTNHINEGNRNITITITKNSDSIGNVEFQAGRTYYFASE